MRPKRCSRSPASSTRSRAEGRATGPSALRDRGATASRGAAKGFGSGSYAPDGFDWRGRHFAIGQASSPKEPSKTSQVESDVASQHIQHRVEPAAKRSRHMKILNSKGSLATTGSRAGKRLSPLGDHPYATAAVVGVAALAISAWSTDGLRRMPSAAIPPGSVSRDRWRPLALRRAWQGRAARPAARQRQHDPGLRVERPPRQGRQEIPRHRLRPARLWAQPAPPRHALVAGGASRPDPRGPRGARRDAGHRPRTLVGRLGRRGPGAQVRDQREGAGSRLRILLPDGPRSTSRRPPDRRSRSSATSCATRWRPSWAGSCGRR